MRARTAKDIFLGAFSENGIGSAKRIIATLIITGVMFCTVWSCVVYGMTDNVKSVIETEILTAGGLLGITSVTNIWKKQQPPSQDDCNNEKED